MIFDQALWKYFFGMVSTWFCTSWCFAEMGWMLLLRVNDYFVVNGPDLIMHTQLPYTFLHFLHCLLPLFLLFLGLLNSVLTVLQHLIHFHYLTFQFGWFWFWWFELLGIWYWVVCMRVVGVIRVWGWLWGCPYMCRSSHRKFYLVKQPWLGSALGLDMPCVGVSKHLLLPLLAHHPLQLG